MKVSELIEQLSFEDPDAQVHYTYRYGDHWNTEVAPKVRLVEQGSVEFSEYHRMPKVVELDEENAKQMDVVLLG